MKVIHGANPDELEANIRQSAAYFSDTDIERNAQKARHARSGRQAYQERRVQEDTTFSDRASSYRSCPVCGSICFADMDTCYGCLHHFESESPRANSAETNQIKAFECAVEPAQKEPARNNITSHHVCRRENGDAFEITVTVRMV